MCFWIERWVFYALLRPIEEAKDMDKMVQKPNYVEELLEILRGSLAADELQMGRASCRERVFPLV